MVEEHIVITKSRAPRGQPKQKMNAERVQNINKHLHPEYSHNNSNLTQQNNAHHGDVSQRPIRQSIKNSSTKRVSVTRVKFGTNNSVKMHYDQYQNEAEIPLNKSDARLKSIKKPRQRRVWFIWMVSAIQICVFIAELVKNWLLTGKPIETKLSTNPLFGPSPLVLINMGSCFPLCMHTIEGIPDVKMMVVPCPNTTISSNYNCTLSDLCGLNGISSTPNQWYRFIIPIFLHIGIIHIGLNLVFQLILGIAMEKSIGALRLATIYFASGIFGFVFSGNFGPEIASRAGCSGSLFAILALVHLDLYYNWKEIQHPRKQFIILFVEIIFNFALGLLPGIDNFSHIGGFCMGLLLGLALMDSPTNLRRSKKAKEYRNNFGESCSSRGYRKFFHNRPKNWWIWWLVRFITFVTAVVIFVLLTENFYTHKIKCAWCKYISCLPIKNWCDIGRLTRIRTTAPLPTPKVVNWYVTHRMRYSGNDSYSLNKI